ncbi:BolA family transcriptional regulator, general stress-responsive regulator [Azospirillaceae bacterium]
MSVYADRIRSHLMTALSPIRLDVVDESSRHIGHAGAHPGGETHFRITVVSSIFSGLPRLERERMIQRLLAAEIAERVHALSVRALTPEEQARCDV